ncbi:MAG: cytidine deaminase [Chloroflexota bacterium]|nr:MAG: cytidine deaminase [Chloroflexota bacterium]
MDTTTAQLITAAKSVCGRFQLTDDFSAGSVGAAILTAEGSIYTGICIDLGCGLGFCAEAAAMAEMLKHRETHISVVVAVSKDCILPPCGRCREMMVQLDVRNLDCQVIVGEDEVARLRVLLPKHWLVQSA